MVLDPLRLTSYGLSVSDVVNVLEDAALDVPAGSFRADDQELLVRTNASAVTESEIREIVIEGNTKVGDVAHVAFGPEDADSLVYWNNRPVIGVGVVRQAHSNTINISDAVRQKVAALNQRFERMELAITEDRAVFIKGSVAEVLSSLAYTVCIVVATIWLFFGSLRMTLIPTMTIPVALIGALAGIWLMGFSINILTLLAIVLGTGLVVDDAIVVLENIQRHRMRGIPARAAAVLGTRQVIFAVVATTAVLVSVFVPIAMLPDTTGRMFREFGLVLAISVAISSFVALSLVPAMSVRLIPSETKPGAIIGGLRSFGHHAAEAYRSSLGGVLRFPWLTFSIAMLIGVGAAILYEYLDKELIPSEDRGVIYANATGPDGVGLTYMMRQAEQMESIIQPVIDRGEGVGLYTVVGQWDPNRVRMMIPLAPWEYRSRSQQDIDTEIKGPLQEIPGVRVRTSSPNSLNIRGAGSGIEAALVGSSYDVIYQAAKDFARAIENDLENLYQADLSYRPTQPQLSIRVDRQKAADLNVPLDDIATTLRTVVDGLDVVDLSVDDASIPVMLETSNATISSPQDIANIYVKSAAGQLLPLSSLVTMKEESVAAELDRHVQRRAIEIDVSMTPGYPLASAVEDLRALAKDMLPDDVSLIFLREAAQLDETSRDILITYGIALLIVFLVLCAQFEGFASAVIVMLIVPFGFAAAILALYITGSSVNIFSQIGLVMLIGLMAKNSILIVEFADQLRDEGASVMEAIKHAADARFRPVVMTMLSTVMGGLPLILSTGPGAEARHAIGWVMFGGLGLAALFTLFLTPVVYLGLARFQAPRASEAQGLQSELEQSTQSSSHINAARGARQR